MNAEDVTNDNIDEFMREQIPISAAEFIMEWFKCPDSCQRTCCKRGRTINVTKREREQLDAVDPSVLEGNEIHELNGVNMTDLHFPCGFLGDDDKCSAYSVRPVPCKIYPFAFSVEHPNHMALNPCPLGVEINRYFGEFMRRLAREMPKEVRLDTLRQIRVNSKTMKEAEVIYHQQETTNNINIGYDLFVMFAQAFKALTEDLPAGEMFKPSAFSQIEFDQEQ